VIEHLSHVALATVAVTTLQDLVGMHIRKVSFWITPICELVLQILHGHTSVVE
jgi:hypothetical protein